MSEKIFVSLGSTQQKKGPVASGPGLSVQLNQAPPFCLPLAPLQGLLSLLVLCLWAAPAWGQATDERGFDQEKLTERAESQAYQYGPEPLPEKEDRDEGSTDLWAGWRYLLYGALALGLGLLLYLLLRRTVLRGTGRLAATAGMTPQDEADLDRLDFPRLIQQAEQQADYRLAVRLWFLSALKAMTDRNLIDWRPHKTDSEYLREIQDPEQRQRFAHLTRAYEYVWYGELVPDAERYQRLTARYQAFVQALN